MATMPLFIQPSEFYELCPPYFKTKEVAMGKGDRRTKRGKIWRNSFGNSRPHKPDKGNGAAEATKSASTAKKPKKPKTAAKK